MLRKAWRWARDIVLGLGRFLGTDMRYIVFQGSWLLSGQVVGNAMSFLLVLVYGNLLSKQTYGDYRYVLSLAGIFMLTSLADMNSAVIRGVAQGFEGVYKRVIRTEITWGLLGSAGALVTAAYYYWRGNMLFGWAFVVAAIAVPFFDTSNTYLYIFAGKQRFDLQARYNILSRVVSAICVILTIVLTKNLLAILAGYYLPYIVIGFVFGPREFKELALNDRTDEGVIRYGKHLSLLAAFSYAVNYLDSIIVFHLLGPIQLAIFSIAQAPVSRVQGVFSVIPEIALPKLAQTEPGIMKRELPRKILKAMLITVPIALAYIVAVPFFFRWFLPQYIDSIPFAQVLGIPLAWYPGVLMNRALSAAGATKKLYIYNTAVSAVQLITIFVGVYLFGIAGAVVGRVAISLLGTLLLIPLVRRL